MQIRNPQLKIFVTVCLLLFFSQTSSASCWCDAGVNPPEPPPGGPPPPCKSCNGQGSPVFVQKGDYIFSITDLQISTRGFPLSVERNYESLRPIDGVFGVGWTSNLTVRLNFSAYLFSAPSTYYKEADVLMPNGRLYRFTQNADGSFTAPVGSHDKLVRNGDGSFDLTPALTRSRYHFSSSGLLQSLTDDYGNAITFTYDENGKLQQVADVTGSGRYLNIYYGADGRISTIRDSSNRQLQYSYNPNGTVASATDPASRTTHYSYNAQGYYAPFLTMISDHWNRVITTISYDSKNRTQSYSEDGVTYTYTYNLTDPNQIRKEGGGTRIDFTTDSQGAIIDRHFNTNPSKTTSYNADGSPSLVTDEVGVKTRYTYNANGSIASLIRDYQGPNAVQYDYTYDSNFPEKVTSITAKNPTTGAVNPDWQAWKYDYYIPGSPAPGALFHVYRVQSNGNTLDTLNTYIYNDAGQVQTMTDATGGISRYSYDSATGDLTSVAYPPNASGGSSRNYQYGRDSLGRVSSVTDPLGKITNYGYDAVDRLTSVTLPKPSSSSPLTFTTTYSYDNYDGASGLVFAQQADPNSKITKQGFDEFGHLIRSIDASNQTTSFLYNDGLLTSITDANGNVTTYVYNGLRQLSRIMTPTWWEDYSYYADGLLHTRGGDLGHIYNYDSLKRLTSHVFPYHQYGGPIQSYSYIGQKLTSTYYLSGITYTYDSSYRKTSEQTPQGTINYTYDAADRVASYSVQNGPTATYSYYPDGSVNTIQWSLAALPVQYTYTVNGKYASITLPNGQHRDYSYDDQGRLLQLANIHPTAGNLATYNYSYDLDNNSGLSTMLGQRTAMISTIPSQGFFNSQTKYYYDTNYQLVRTDYPNVAPFNGEVDSWSYDSIGNRTSKSANSVTTNYTYFQNASSKNGQRLQSDGVNTAYAYNPFGNVSYYNAAADPLMYYDDLNNLSAVNYGNGTHYNYAYDIWNRRITKDLNSTTTINYLYEGQNLVRYNYSPAIDTYDVLFGPGIDEPLAISRNGATSQYYVVDGLGSVALLNDANGVVLNKYVYDAWGVVKSQTASFNNAFTYTGREPSFEAGLALMYYRARYYSPQIGRFINEDPARFDGGINFYRYVSNDPVLLVDPFGLCDVQVRCRPIRGERGFIEKEIVPLFGYHCYILATDRDTKFLQISAGATPDRSRSVSGSRPQGKGTEPNYTENECVKCNGNKPTNVSCDKVDCLTKMARTYNDRKYGYDPLANKAPNSNSFVGWIMTVCGMRMDPDAWPWQARGCYYWTGED